MKKGLIDKTDMQYDCLANELDGQVLIDIIENEAILGDDGNVIMEANISYVIASPERFMELKGMANEALDSLASNNKIVDFKSKIKALPDVEITPPE